MADAKKRKFDHHSNKKNYYMKNNRRTFMEAGQRGFLATCNFREKDCVRECYNILNQYADELYGAENFTNADKPSGEPPEKHGSDDEDEDIMTKLSDEIKKSKIELKHKNKRRFQQVDTGTSNCIFIKTTLEDPVDFGLKIIRNIAENKKQETRFLLRFIPIEAVCKANLKDIIDAAGVLSDKYFLKEPKTFSIIFQRRYNNNINRDDVIKEVAEMITSKNINNKVDLKGAEVSVIIEVIKGLCCISIAPDYLKLRKYNLVELVNPSPTKEQTPKVEDVERKPETIPDVEMDQKSEVIPDVIEMDQKSGVTDDIIEKIDSDE